MPLRRYLEREPSLGDGVRMDDLAFVIGEVRVAGPAALARHAVLRGDRNAILVGPRFHMGARSTVHVEQQRTARIGADVWIGEDAVVHACGLGDGVRVENGGLVLSGSDVGAGSIVSADSLVSEGASFPENSYIAGTPGRRIRETTPEEREETLRRVAQALR